jgi:hypothetical protein
MAATASVLSEPIIQVVPALARAKMNTMAEIRADQVEEHVETPEVPP